MFVLTFPLKTSVLKDARKILVECLNVELLLLVVLTPDEINYSNAKNSLVMALDFRRSSASVVCSQKSQGDVIHNKMINRQSPLMFLTQYPKHFL